MIEFPKEWCTDVCPEVVDWLNEKYSRIKCTTLDGYNKFYGENNFDWKSRDNLFGTYISHEEFMELAGLSSKEPTMKVGDMVWVEDVSEELARKHKEERELLAILPEYITDRRYICRMSKSSSNAWYFAVPIVKEEKKERKLMLTDQEWEKLEKVYK